MQVRFGEQLPQVERHLERLIVRLESGGRPRPGKDGEQIVEGWCRTWSSEEIDNRLLQLLVDRPGQRQQIRDRLINARDLYVKRGEIIDALGEQEQLLKATTTVSIGIRSRADQRLLHLGRNVDSKSNGR